MKPFGFLFVLGHGSHSLATALSYANVVIDLKYESEVFELPPAHWMALFNTQLKTLQEEVNVLKKQVNKDIPAIEKTVSDQDSTEVGFCSQVR